MQRSFFAPVFARWQGAFLAEAKSDPQARAAAARPRIFVLWLCLFCAVSCSKESVEQAPEQVVNSPVAADQEPSAAFDQSQAAGDEAAAIRGQPPRAGTTPETDR